jgi:hypothetical protein
VGRARNGTDSKQKNFSFKKRDPNQRKAKRQLQQNITDVNGKLRNVAQEKDEET